jgi:hypothetical protein
MHGDEVGLRVSNGDQAVMVFLTDGSAGVLAQLLLRASTTIAHPAMAEWLDVGDWQGASELLLTSIGKSI